MKNSTTDIDEVNRRIRRFHIDLANLTESEEDTQPFEANVVFQAEGLRSKWQGVKNLTLMVWFIITGKPFMVTMLLTIPKRELHITQIFNNN